MEVYEGVYLLGGSLEFVVHVGRRGDRAFHVYGRGQLAGAHGEDVGALERWQVGARAGEHAYPRELDVRQYRLEPFPFYHGGDGEDAVAELEGV